MTDENSPVPTNMLCRLVGESELVSQMLTESAAPEPQVYPCDPSLTLGEAIAWRIKLILRLESLESEFSKA